MTILKKRQANRKCPQSKMMQVWHSIRIKPDRECKQAIIILFSFLLSLITQSLSQQTLLVTGWWCELSCCSGVFVVTLSRVWTSHGEVSTDDAYCCGALRRVRTLPVSAGQMTNTVLWRICWQTCRKFESNQTSTARNLHHTTIHNISRYTTNQDGHQ